jgi:hypothetical protein
MAPISCQIVRNIVVASGALQIDPVQFAQRLWDSGYRRYVLCMASSLHKFIAIPMRFRATRD